MNSSSISRSFLTLALLLIVSASTAIAQQSPWDKHDPNSPWDSIDPLSVWDNPNAGKSWVTSNPYRGPIAGRWRSVHRGSAGEHIIDWQLEENGSSIRMYPTTGPANQENTYVGTRRGHFIIVTYPVGGLYQCPKGSDMYPVKAIDEIGISDDGRKLIHKIRDWDLTGEPPNCKVILKDTWNEHIVFERLGTLKELRYVELKNGKYSPIEGELKHGATFYIEATFDSKPADSEYEVQLSWGGADGAEVKLTASSDPTILRSQPIRLEAPAVNQ